jgi:hypothetical protein
MRCQKPKRDGSQCKASALTGKKYCALHSDASRAAELWKQRRSSAHGIWSRQLKDVPCAKERS